jgi:hypothetical protein
MLHGPMLFMLFLSSLSLFFFWFFLRLLFGSWRLWFWRSIIFFRLIFSRIITFTYFSSFIRFLFPSKLWEKLPDLFLNPNKGVMRIWILKDHSLRILIFLFKLLPSFSFLVNTSGLLFSSSAFLLFSLPILLLYRLLFCFESCLLLAV